MKHTCNTCIWKNGYRCTKRNTLVIPKEFEDIVKCDNWEPI